MLSSHSLHNGFFFIEVTRWLQKHLLFVSLKIEQGARKTPAPACGAPCCLATRTRVYYISEIKLRMYFLFTVKTENSAKGLEETEVWRKPGRKQRGLLRPSIDSAGDARKHSRDEDDAPAPRASHERYSKHRSRLKSDALDEPARRLAKYSRDRKDVSDVDSKDYFPVDKDDFTDDKSKEFDDDVKFVKEVTTRQGSRQKPQDRYIKRKSSDLDMAYDDDDLELRVKPIEDPSSKGMQHTRPPELAGVPQSARVLSRERFRPPDEEEDVQSRVQLLGGKHKQKPYEDYDDYYDMKRVHSIKNKLPVLLHRTTSTCSGLPVYSVNISCEHVGEVSCVRPCLDDFTAYFICSYRIAKYVLNYVKCIYLTN